MMWLLGFSLAGLFYIYAGYPLAVWLLGRVWPLPVRKAYQPRSVSVVIACHNESKHIVRKLDNLLRLNHADTIREVLIGSDGCTDDTDALVAGYNDPRVQLIGFSSRRGKAAVLNDLVSRCTSEIVLLADARQEFAPSCLERLVANFDAPSIGVVSGELVLRAEHSCTTAAEGIGLYWCYEKLIRKAESRFRGVPGATGACYAIRRDLFRPISPATILDDVAIPMHVVAQGFRCVLEPNALAFDTPSKSPEQEALRKRRTIAGAAQLAHQYPHWLVPGGHPLWWEFVSHKLLRLLSPVLLVCALIANLTLASQPGFRVLLSVQTVCYIAAACGWLAQRHGMRWSLFGPFLMFVTLNITTLAALWDAVRSQYNVTWRKA